MRVVLAARLISAADIGRTEALTLTGAQTEAAGTATPSSSRGLIHNLVPPAGPLSRDQSTRSMRFIDHEIRRRFI